MENNYFSPKFKQQLREFGYPVQDMSGKPIPVLANWTGLPQREISNGLYNPLRDEVRPIVTAALNEVLDPWIEQNTTELPSITVLEIARMTGLSPEVVIQAVQQYPFELNGAVSSISDLTSLKCNQGLPSCRELAVSAKSIIRDSRYQSRPPGGGPVQKTRIDERKISPKIKLEARRRARIKFQQPSTDTIGIVPELEVENTSCQTPVESVLGDDPQKADILQVMDILRERGFGNKWLLGNNVGLLAMNLLKLSRGEPVDFVIWNCIGFKDWQQDTPGAKPSCKLTPNQESPITGFFAAEIIEMIEIFSLIGNPQFTILLPTNEAFDENVWNYRQSLDERDQIMNSAVDVVQGIFRGQQIPDNAQLEVMRWDRFLQRREAKKPPEFYSEQGYRRLLQDPDFQRIRGEAVRSGQSYYEGMRIKPKTLEEMQLRYYGVYAGEGIAFSELQAIGNPIVVLNFEEMRCSQMALRGANGNLAVVTPIKPEQMTAYYQSQN